MRIHFNGFRSIDKNASGSGWSKPLSHDVYRGEATSGNYGAGSLHTLAQPGDMFALYEMISKYFPSIRM